MESELFAKFNIPNDAKEIMGKHEFDLHVKSSLLSSLNNHIMDSMKVHDVYNPQYDTIQFTTSFVIMDRSRYKQLLKIEREHNTLLSYRNKPVIELHSDEGIEK